MSKSGYLENVYSLDKDERTIHLPKLPPLVFHKFYNTKTHKNSKILRLVWLQQSTYSKKIIVLDEIDLGKNKKELRLRYNIIGDKPRMRGKWTFGQFATFIPPKDFRRLITLAKRRNMF